MVFRDHVIRKRTGSIKSEVWIRDDELEKIWDDFKPDVTYKKKLAIKMLKDETREMRRKWQEKMREMNAMLGKVSKVQESTPDGEDCEEDREQREKIEALQKNWDDTESEGESNTNGVGEYDTTQRRLVRTLRNREKTRHGLEGT